MGLWFWVSFVRKWCAGEQTGLYNIKAGKEDLNRKWPVGKYSKLPQPPQKSHRGGGGHVFSPQPENGGESSSLLQNITKFMKGLHKV